jgi:hypothetical protein
MLAEQRIGNGFPSAVSSDWSTTMVMEVGLESGGTATIKITRRTWGKIAIFIIGCVLAHAKYQATQVNDLCLRIERLQTKVSDTDKAVADFKNDYRSTMGQMRTDISDLMIYLHSRDSQPVAKSQ